MERQNNSTQSFNPSLRNKVINNGLASLFPFQSKYIPLNAGEMHYIDEGIGKPVLFIHGTPTWSFLYRNQIKSMSKTARCIAPDHLGFGLSVKNEKFNGTPEWHSYNLEEFINRLNLKEITLVVHDFGGPIGLSIAIRRPELFSKIVILNTFLWEMESNKQVRQIDRIVKSPLGKILYRYFNFSPRILIRQGFHNKKLLSKSIHKAYVSVFPKSADRMGPFKLALNLRGSSDWYQEQWDQLEKIEDKQVIFIWGKYDTFITTDYLNRWKGRFPKAKSYQLSGGHFLQEECADALSEILMSFLKHK